MSTITFTRVVQLSVATMNLRPVGFASMWSSKARRAELCFPASTARARSCAMAFNGKSQTLLGAAINYSASTASIQKVLQGVLHQKTQENTQYGHEWRGLEYWRCSSYFGSISIRQTTTIPTTGSHPRLDGHRKVPGHNSLWQERWNCQGCQPDLSAWL